MTAYFDAKHAELHRFFPDREKDVSATCKFLERFDEGIVFDVAVCSEQPGFPEHLREAINKVILKRSLYGQPSNRDRSEAPNPDTWEEHFDLMHNLVWDLHTVFHEVSHWSNAHRDNDADGNPFSDSPLTPLRRLASLSEERREKMMAKGPGEPEGG